MILTIVCIILSVMKDAIIEVDEKLERERTEPNQSYVTAIYAQLSSLDRDVNKLVSRMHHGLPQHDPINAKQEHSKREPIEKNILPKYNYYGKKYRYEQKQQQLNVPQPDKDLSFYSQEHQRLQKKMRKQVQELSQPAYSKSRDTKKAQLGTQPFFDDGKVKFPTQNYYIYFDSPKTKGKKPKKSVEEEQKNSNRFKPAWLMDKKINSLQKQMKKLKEREKRNRQAATMPNFNKTKQTGDYPINLKSNLEKMIDTLWI